MACSMKSFDDLKDFQKQLMQSFIDTALEAEMEDHLGYPKHEKADKPNKRNGHTKKRVRSDTGDIEISTPRDRDSSSRRVSKLFTADLIEQNMEIFKLLRNPADERELHSNSNAETLKYAPQSALKGLTSDNTNDVSNVANIANESVPVSPKRYRRP